MSNRFYAHCMVGSVFVNFMFSAGFYLFHGWQYRRLEDKLYSIDDEEGTAEQKKQLKIAIRKLEEYSYIYRKYPLFIVLNSPPKINFKSLPQKH
jgi:hypothetical protein